MGEYKECMIEEQMTEWMSMALDNELGTEELRQLQEHLVSCSRCSIEWESMKWVSNVFDQSPMIGPPLGFAIRVERRLKEKTQRRRRVFGGIAVLTGSLSLAGMTVASVVLLILGIVTWRNMDFLPEVQQSTSAVSSLASGMGLVGKGASRFLFEALVRYGAPLLVLVGAGLVVLASIWFWMFSKRADNSHHNGYV